jgi:acetolactate synthase-1/2/3 large subunit
MADAPTYRPTPPVPDENFGGAFVLLNCLYAEGVREIFGLPGGAVSELTTAMQRRGDIEFILARHEQGAGFMAYGHAKATKRAAVCLSTQGPGACNLVNVAGSATVDKVPLIILTGVASNATHFRRGFQNIDTKGS